jgi:hypothetical protein
MTYTIHETKHEGVEAASQALFYLCVLKRGVLQRAHRLQHALHVHNPRRLLFLHHPRRRPHEAGKVGERGRRVARSERSRRYAAQSALNSRQRLPNLQHGIPFLNVIETFIFTVYDSAALAVA